MFFRRHQTTKIIVCIATNHKNLKSAYGEQLQLSDDYEDIESTVKCSVGDILNGDGSVTKQPQNYPPPPTPDEFSAAFMRKAVLEFFTAYEDAGKQLTPHLQQAVDRWRQKNP